VDHFALPLVCRQNSFCYSFKQPHIGSGHAVQEISDEEQYALKILLLVE